MIRSRNQRLLIMKHFIERLKYRLTQPLPGLEVQMRMAPAIRGKNNDFPPNVRVGGVLILLYPYQNELHTVLMKRTEDGGTHSGQVSFPGGKVEESDKDLIHTALREAEEEVGVLMSQVEVLGRASELYIPPSNFLVYPTIGFCAERPNFVTDPNEVAHIIEVPISYLLQEEIVGSKKVPMSAQKHIMMEVPVYEIYEHTVWGATAMMISEFLTLVREIY